MFVSLLACGSFVVKTSDNDNQLLFLMKTHVIYLDDNMNLITRV